MRAEAGEEMGADSQQYRSTEEYRSRKGSLPDTPCPTQRFFSGNTLMVLSTGLP